MHILHVAPYFGSFFGGTTTVIRDVCSHLSARGHDVTVATSDYHIDGDGLAPIDQFRTVMFPTRLNLGLLIYTPEMMRWLSRNAADYDVIHLHTFRSYQNVAARRAAMALDIPYVLQAHGGVLPSYGKKILKETFDVVYGSKILADASSLIAVSPMEVEQYRSMGVEDRLIKLLPNGLELDGFRNLPPRSAFRSSHGLGEGDKVVLFLGRVDRIKGLDLLVDAFSSFAKEKTNSKLIIAGPDFGYRRSIEDKVREYGIEGDVLFTGSLDRSEKIKALVAADACVVPSSFDIFSMTALEAMACGTPLIITDRCGIADLVRDSSMVIPYDRSELTRALTKVLTDSTVSDGLAQAGRQKVKEFELSHVISHLEGLYSSFSHH